ncbi:hypothetical protein BD770DRAFT_391788, partial [Pilaira anomala]
NLVDHLLNLVDLQFKVLLLVLVMVLSSLVLLVPVLILIRVEISYTLVQTMELHLFKLLLIPTCLLSDLMTVIPLQVSPVPVHIPIQVDML